jgi:outer membrane beta-barrel protein
MKRPAICLFVWVAIVGWAATGHAKKGGGKAAAPAADQPADDSAGSADSGDQKAAPADDSKPAAGGKDAAGAASESLDTSDETQPAKVEEDLGAPKPAARATSTLSWNDILVVPRKRFIKAGRFELQPFTGLSVNDTLIRHYVFGADLNFFLTDVLWIGLQGQYFIKQLTNQEEVVGLVYNRAPTLNQYLYGGSFNFGYVPLYGKFALFNRHIMHWEMWASAGVGVTITKVIPRDPANDALAFQNTDLTPNVGIGSRFFIFDWLTVNFALRDYLVPDKFEPLLDGAQATPAITTADEAKANAHSALVNNLMFYAGVGFYLPTKFQYKTPR